jgi:hypothetical protein
MKRGIIYRVLAIGTSILILFVFIIILSHKNEQGKKQERVYYVKNLKYKFCGTITNTEHLDQRWGYGYLYCKLDSGVLIDSTVEDSLQTSLQYYDELRFIITNSVGIQVKLYVPAILKIEVGDRICIDTDGDAIYYYDEEIFKHRSSVSSCLLSRE